MGELIFKSAGVSTREIDLSGPTIAGPTGVPAGIIGTSNQGPAFVPVTFATFSQFQSIFGDSDGKKFGPLAVNEWLKNARACTYIRVLGAGNCQQRLASGIVTNAGFFAGDQIIQDTGLVNRNLQANQTGIASIKGRTYFIGTFMSESNGSTIFSSAGLQAASTKASKTEVLDMNGRYNTTFTITVVIPVRAGATTPGTLTIGFETGVLAAAASTIKIRTNGGNITDDEDLAYVLGKLISGEDPTGSSVLPSGGDVAATDFKFATGTTVGATPPATLGLKATRAAKKLTIEATNIGVAGNGYTFTSATGGVVLPSSPQSLAGGGGGAVPILRGVLLAPSGVVLSLSGNSTATGNDPVYTDPAVTANGVIFPRSGGVTGSLALASQNFTLLLNGYKNKEKNVITASFDTTSPSYFSNVFNTDPFKIEQEGHLLYSHYDINSGLATVTGSGNTGAGIYSKGITDSSKEDIAFILTSSKGRGSDAATLASVPDYEDFRDRFTTPITPSIISQNFGGTPYSLFQIEALSDGAFANTKYKVSIENLKKSTSATYKYGTFDLVVRNFYDTDEERQIIEAYRGLSLDSTSDRYITRAIGDQNTFFDFDSAVSSQKIIVDGDYPVRSNYIRVKPSNALKNNNVPAEALPVGFRGFSHLVTSGSLLCKEADSLYSRTDLLQTVNEPPVPLRDTITLSTGLNKRDDARLYWGVQTNIKSSPIEPNKPSLFDNSFESYVKYAPSHRTDTTKVKVGENPGAANVLGSILDCDLYNNNIFTLERLKIRTGSTADGGYADAEQWLSASYIRNGVIATDTTLKTRAWRVDDLSRVANSRYAKFTTLMQGGFDGLNIFNQGRMAMNNASVFREKEDELNQFGKNGSSTAAYRKAVDIMGSKSDVEIQLLAVPGIRNSTVTDYTITAMENRFDAMYIMDLEERDVLNTVITSSAQRPHVLNTVNSFTNRGLDSSFASVYFPDMVVRDPTTLDNVQVPPSVAVLGAFSLNDQLAHPWFAPAGFTRGALESVELAAVRLNRTNLDDLYSADINPITAFPGTGTVVWGQKTLLATPSALDRVNVRRLLIDVRRKVRNVANSLLFEPNRVETLEKFSSLVNPILQSVQEQSGVDRYKVVIDTTTTTQADVENNTIRGKIFLQPTRTAEFISLDFVVTNAGSNI